jgi:hypothetical protein
MSRAEFAVVPLGIMDLAVGTPKTDGGLLLDYGPCSALRRWFEAQEPCNRQSIKLTSKTHKADWLKEY